MYIAVCEYREVPGEEEATNRNIQFFFFLYMIHTFYVLTINTHPTNSLNKVQFQQLLNLYTFGTGVPSQGVLEQSSISPALQCRYYTACMKWAYRVLVGKPEGKRPLVRPRHRWVDNIGMDLQEVGCGYVDWIGLAQDRDRWQTLVSAVMNLRVP